MIDDVIRDAKIRDATIRAADGCILRCGVKCEKNADYWPTKLTDGHHLSRDSQVALNTAMHNFNSGQFKTRMKKVASQVNLYLFLNVFLSSELFLLSKIICSSCQW